MIDPETPSGTQFDRLLSVMPRMAQAVNAFESEDNRRLALQVLVRVFGLPDGPPAPEEVAEPALSVVPSPGDDRVEESDQGEAGPGIAVGDESAVRRRSRKSAARKSWPSVPDINFRPDGKQSLREFAKAKAPANIDERNAVAVYYLQEILGIAAIHVGHVVAAYTECDWRYPANPGNKLSVTASKTNWLVTSDMKAIRLTHQGRNLVHLDLPRSRAKKSA